MPRYPDLPDGLFPSYKFCLQNYYIFFTYARGM